MTMRRNNATAPCSVAIGTIGAIRCKFHTHLDDELVKRREALPHARDRDRGRQRDLLERHLVE
jgi:hypothetical protein